MRHNQSINFGYTLAYRKNCMICIWVQSYEKYLILVDGNLKNNNFCKFKIEVQNFGFILTLVNQTLKKPAGLPSGWGRVAPKERKM